MPRFYLRVDKDRLIRLCQDRAVPYLMRFCTRVVMISYALLLLKPVMPILVDNIAHSLWTKQHYQLVHKHGGKAHVHAELQKIVNKDRQEKGSIRYEWQGDIAPHLAANASAWVVSKHFYSRQIYFDYVCRYPVRYTVPDYPPPRV